MTTVISIIITLVILAVCSSLSVWLFMTEHYLYLTVTIIGIVTSFLRVVMLYRNKIKKVAFMFNALKCDDYSFTFTENLESSIDSEFNISLNRIKGIIENAKNRAIEKEKYYELLMNTVNSGVITIDNKGHIYQVNDKALKLFGLQILTHVNQLTKIDIKLTDTILNIEPNSNSLISIITERGEIFIRIDAVEIEINGKELKILSVNNISNDLDEREVESWQKLIKVLTHEIMNSLAPITSLSKTLLDISDNENEEVIEGLQTIQHTSNHLMEFVESYRKVTRIATPIKEPLNLSQLIDNTINLINNNNVEISVDISPDDIMIYADKNQVTQVLINIINNGIQSGANNIYIKCFIDSDENIIIDVKNNGAIVSNTKDIFTPFFSTKTEGTGVGLSISRQIMQLHKGEIILSCNRKDEVTFSLIFS